MERDTIIAGRILDDMTDGVLAIDLTGKIITFNPSAAGILGISRKEALGRTFGEIFLLVEENDDFNQTILDEMGFRRRCGPRQPLPGKGPASL